MKKILAIIALLFALSSTAWANPTDMVGSSDKTLLSVVVFMNERVLSDTKAIAEIRDVLKNKFKYANSVVFYGDDQAKPPAFLEFVERVKTDPLNEKRIKAISLGALAQYGKASKSSYIVPITITPFNNWVVGEGGDTRAQVSVLDVASVRNVECLNSKFQLGVRIEKNRRKNSRRFQMVSSCGGACRQADNP